MLKELIHKPKISGTHRGKELEKFIGPRTERRTIDYTARLWKKRMVTRVDGVRQRYRYKDSVQITRTIKTELPGARKVHFRTSKLQYSYKLKSTRGRYKSTFIAYTKKHKKTFKQMIKDHLVPMQRKQRKPKKIIDLKRPFKKQQIIREWKEQVSP